MRSPSERLRTHLRSNIVGYVALFVALSATAWAAPKIGSQDIAKNAVKAKHIKDGQVGTAEVGDNALTGNDIDEASLQGLPGGQSYSATGPLTLNGTSFGLQGCPANQVLKRNASGTAWECAPDVDTNSGGTVTSVGSGSGLTGGPVTTSGTLSLIPCTANQILKFSAGNWGCASDNSGGPPSGSAGGDLQGTYPNPTLADGAVSGGPGGEITDGTVAPDDIDEIPAVDAYSFNATTVSETAGYVVLPLDNERYDTTATMHSTTTNNERVIAPRPGLYQVNARVRFDASNTGLVRAARLHALGPLIDYDFARGTTSPQGVALDAFVSLAGAVSLATGDYVQVEVDHDVTGGLGLRVNPITMYWVGPRP